MIKQYLLFPLFTCISLFGTAQDIQKDFKTSSISIFKNKSAFFIKSGTVETTDGTYRITENIPPALFGTYWMSSPNGELTSMSSYMDTVQTKKSATANSILDMLKANIGKDVVLYFDQTGFARGTIATIQPNTLPSQNIVTLQTSDRWLTLPVSNIKRVDFLEKPTQEFELEQQDVKPVLEVNFASNSNKQSLDLMYLAGGLSWTPLYLIELTNEQRARLTLRAEVVNDVENIEETDVHFVVGVPNFSFANRLSPLVQLAIPNFVNHLATREVNAFSNTLTAQTFNYTTLNEDPFDLEETSASGLEGSAEEDLYFYTLKNMTLRKGGRGHYPVFSADVNIEHIYECNLPQNTANPSFYRESFLFDPNPNKVFHSIKLQNNTTYPFTTGAAMVIKRDGTTKPISQDRLNYTPVKGHSFVKLTEAPDVHIKQAEKATNREENARKVSRDRNIYYYDLITVTGQIEVKNYKNKEIDLNIRRPIIGDLQQSSVKWLKEERINSNGDLNTITDVCWETSIAAEEELTITYSYQIYVPH